MEPLHPDTKRAILNANPQAEPDVEEYERLLAERFTLDPDAPAPQPQAIALVHESRERRLEELYRRITAGRNDR